MPTHRKRRYNPRRRRRRNPFDLGNLSKGQLALIAGIVGGAYWLTKPKAPETYTPPPVPVGTAPNPYATPSQTTQASIPSGTGKFLDPNVLKTARQYYPSDQLMAIIETGNKLVFQKPYTAKQANESPYKIVNGQRVLDPTAIGAKSDLELRRLTIELNTWPSFRYFGSLLAIGFILSTQDTNAAAKQFGLSLIEWFAYHRWKIGPALKTQMVEAGTGFSCKEDPRLPAFDMERGYPPQINPTTGADIKDSTGRTGGARPIWPAIDNWGFRPSALDKAKQVPQACFTQLDRTVVSLAQEQQRFLANLSQANTFFNEGYTSGSTATAVPGIGPCDALVEYAAARYMQVAFVSGIDPALGKLAGDALIASAGKAGAIAAAAIVTAIAGSASIPVVGWITAAVAAIGAFVAGLIFMGQTIAKTQDARAAVAKKLNDILIGGWDNYRLASGVWGPGNGIIRFSGYRLQCLIPEKYPWDDIKDLLFNHFALTTSTAPIGLAPQLPFFYLGVDFYLPVSVEVPLNNIIALMPTLDANGNVSAWQWKGFTFKEFGDYLMTYMGQIKKVIGS